MNGEILRPFAPQNDMSSKSAGRLQRAVRSASSEYVSY